MHYLQTTGQNDIAVTVCTVIILVNVTADNLNAVSFLGSGKYAVTGTACCYEQDIYAFSDQSIAQYLTGSFIREVTNIVTAYISAGNIGTCVRRKLYYFYVHAFGTVHILNTALETILIVNVGRICDTVYYCYLTCGGRQSCSHTCIETALLLSIVSSVYIVDHLISSYFGTVNGRPGIDQDKLGIRILLCQITDAGELETTAYNNIIISYNISYCLNSCCAVTGLLTDGGYGCIRILLDELQNTVVVVLVEGTVIHAGGAGYDSDLQTGLFTAALCSCCSGGSCCTGFCIGVSIGAAACYQRNSHDRCKCKCQKLFHNFFLLKM